MVLLLECLAVAPGTGAVEATGGRVLAAPDLTAGDTIVHAFELPPIGALVVAPRLAIAAGGTGPGWRSAGLSLSVDGGATWSPVGTTAAPAVLGKIISPPGPASAALADRVNTLVVELENGGMLLHNADDAALAAGSNLAMAGDELLQFAHAVPLGAHRWKLSGLWRGRRGTEAAIGTQTAGDRFVLVAADTLATTDLPLQAIGGAAHIAAHGADGGAAEAVAEISGLSLVPPSPVHLREVVTPEGSIEICWVRRSRNGWDWVDGVDAPLGEEAERYAVTLALRSGGERIVETSEAHLQVGDTERAEVAAVTIRQIGSFGLSSPATIELPLMGEI